MRKTETLEKFELDLEKVLKERDQERFDKLLASCTEHYEIEHLMDIVQKFTDSANFFTRSSYLNMMKASIKHFLNFLTPHNASFFLDYNMFAKMLARIDANFSEVEIAEILKLKNPEGYSFGYFCRDRMFEQYYFSNRKPKKTKLRILFDSMELEINEKSNMDFFEGYIKSGQISVVDLFVKSLKLFGFNRTKIAFSNIEFNLANFMSIYSGVSIGKSDFSLAFVQYFFNDKALIDHHLSACSNRQAEVAWYMSDFEQDAGGLTLRHDSGVSLRTCIEKLLAENISPRGEKKGNSYQVAIFVAESLLRSDNAIRAYFLSGPAVRISQEVCGFRYKQVFDKEALRFMVFHNLVDIKMYRRLRDLCFDAYSVSFFCLPPVEAFRCMAMELQYHSETLIPHIKEDRSNFLKRVRSKAIDINGEDENGFTLLQISLGANYAPRYFTLLLDEIIRIGDDEKAGERIRGFLNERAASASLSHNFEREDRGRHIAVSLDWIKFLVNDCKAKITRVDIHIAPTREIKDYLLSKLYHEKLLILLGLFKRKGSIFDILPENPLKQDVKFFMIRQIMSQVRLYKLRSELYQAIEKHEVGKIKSLTKDGAIDINQKYKAGEWDEPQSLFSYALKNNACYCNAEAGEQYFSMMKYMVYSLKGEFKKEDLDHSEITDKSAKDFLSLALEKRMRQENATILYGIFRYRRSAIRGFQESGKDVMKGIAKLVLGKPSGLL